MVDSEQAAHYPPLRNNLPQDRLEMQVQVKLQAPIQGQVQVQMQNVRGK